MIDCNPGSVVVVRIEQGHTAFQNRFDERYKAITRAMEEYAVRDVMNRRTSAFVVQSAASVCALQAPSPNREFPREGAP